MGTFHYTDEQWGPIGDALTAGGVRRNGAREILEFYVGLWIHSRTKREARDATRATRKRIDRFLRAAEDLDATVLLPSAALPHFLNILRVLRAEAKDAWMVKGARRSLGEHLCWVWRYKFGREIRRSITSEGGKPSGPMVRFLVAASRPIPEASLDEGAASSRIVACQKLVKDGTWSGRPQTW